VATVDLAPWARPQHVELQPALLVHAGQFRGEPAVHQRRRQAEMGRQVMAAPRQEIVRAGRLAPRAGEPLPNRLDDPGQHRPGGLLCGVLEEFGRVHGWSGAGSQE
jgi:hypothetical protein